MSQCKLIVTTTFGLEKIVKTELQDLGFYNVKTSDGRIEFDAAFEDIPRLNIWLRAADRVLLKLAEFPAKDFDDLFEGVGSVDWLKWIPENAKITVLGSVTRSKIDSARYTQSITKKAIVEFFKTKSNIERLPETGEEYVVRVSVVRDMVQLTLDSSGAGLHKRGYRLDSGEAPIRENLAAALVMLSSWNKNRVLIDPLCGAGTIAIEAAMIARNIAPGLNRTFASENWDYVPQKSWDDARRFAPMKIKKDLDLQIFASDVDPDLIANCRDNAKRAGVENDILFEQKDIRDLQLSSDEGVMISNPPYGVRIGSEYDVGFVYMALEALLKDKPHWALFLITADKNYPNSFSRSKPDKVRKLYNGNLEVQYFQYLAQKEH